MKTLYRFRTQQLLSLTAHGRLQHKSQSHLEGSFILLLNGPQRKHRLQKFVYCCARIRLQLQLVYGAVA
jgi:hypothetical protein